MTKKILFVLTCLFFALMGLMLTALTGCKDSVSNPENNDRNQIQYSVLEKEVAGSASRFGFQIFNKICESARDSNVFISPLSISMALGMTLNGAAGDTYAAMKQTLELNGLTEEEINQTYQSLITTLTQADSEVDFNIANSIWYRNTMTFEPDFIQRNIDYFSAAINPMDFNDPQTVTVINNWVNTSTNGKIEEIIDQIGPDVVMYLINALYFKGTWKEEFNPDATVDDIFYMTNGNNVPCKMMVQKNDYLYFANDLFQAVNLPYGDEQFYMTVFLPKGENVVETVIEEMNAANWEQWLTSFAETELTLRMPRIKLEYEKELKEVLTQLGMGVAFTERADFTRMFQPGYLSISKVKHKTFLEVNEEGTEAAAVTAVEIVLESVGGQLIMNLNKPFVFVIHEKDSGAILFMGKISSPAN